MDPVKEVEEGIAELNKGLPAEEGPVQDNRSVTEKALDGMNKALDAVNRALGIKKSVSDGPADEPEDKLEKSGEDRQEEGDQNKLNSGPMNRKERMAKIFDYLNKMDDSELDEYENAMVTAKYPDTGVRKSLSDRLDGVNDEDAAIVVNEFLEEVSTDIAEMKKSIVLGLTADAAILKGLSAFAQASREAGEAGRGRKSKVSLLTKGLGENVVEDSSAIDWNATMKKALQLSGKGELPAERVSGLEFAMNNGLSPDPDTMAIINAAA